MQEHMEASRNLIVLVDGTWVSATDTEKKESRSNVYKLGLHLPTYTSNFKPQSIIYEPGIGSNTQGLKYLGGVFAYGIERMIEKIYMHICNNFDYTTSISIFGFSRGAVIARAVAGIVSLCGILKVEHSNKFHELYTLYKSGKQSNELKDFIGKYCYFDDVYIDILGVFDTVYGGTHSSKSYFDRLHFSSSNLKLPSKVRTGIQILAKDENRWLFRPLIWSGKNDDQNMVQCWIPGCHGDIGGTFRHNKISDISLLTMILLSMKFSKNIYFAKDETDELFGVKYFNTNSLKYSIKENRIIALHQTPKLYRPFEYVRKIYVEPTCMHPIVHDMNKKEILFRGKKKVYQLDIPPTDFSFDFSQIDVLNSLEFT